MMLHMMKFFISKGHECRVILHHYSGPMYTYEGIDVFPATGHLDAYRWSDIILTHLDMSQFTMIMAHQVQKPLVHICHNDIIYNCILNSGRGNYVAYNSEWLKKSLGYNLPSTIIHPPCDISYYDVSKDPISNDAITLISLNERKGGELFARIAKAMPDRKFIGVVGSYDNPGPLKLSQQDIIAMMPPNVEIVQNSPDILSVYRRTRILLMPSDYESWGRTATEAMCNGIPVIITPTPGLLENCGKAGIFVGVPLYNPEPGEACVDIGSVEEWVLAIRQLDNPDYYRQKSLSCRARARELDPVKELEALEQFIINARF